MKKIFLLFGIAAFTSVSAQQKDILDIQKHIIKKQADDKKIVEKNKFALPSFKKLQFVIPIAHPQSNFSYTLSNGDIVRYGNGTMPCIKPDISEFQTMPNLTNDLQFNFNYSPLKVLPGQTPNASEPYRTISSK